MLGFNHKDNDRIYNNILRYNQNENKNYIIVKNGK